jgi:hypothetical protein
MRTIVLVARGNVAYHGPHRSYAVAAGEVFEADAIDAAVLRYRNEVMFAPRGLRPSLPTTSASAPSPPMSSAIAEDATMPRVRWCPPDAVVGEPLTEPETPTRRRRTYARRDLEAEE